MARDVMESRRPMFFAQTLLLKAQLTSLASMVAICHVAIKRCGELVSKVAITNTFKKGILSRDRYKHATYVHFVSSLDRMPLSCPPACLFFESLKASVSASMEDVNKSKSLKIWLGTQPTTVLSSSLSEVWSTIGVIRHECLCTFYKLEISDSGARWGYIQISEYSGTP